MRVKYYRIRIGLLTLALGLAGARFFDAYHKTDEVWVDIPEARSAEILPVFVKHRFSGLGGGSGSAHGTISLTYDERSDSDRIEFELENYTDRPIFLPAVTGISQIPYFLECQSQKYGAITMLPSDLDFSSEIIQMAPRQHMKIRIPRPENAKTCVLVVPFGYTSSEAKIFANRDLFLIKNDVDLLERLPNWTRSFFKVGSRMRAGIPSP